MATARKQPSGKWMIRVYSHSENGKRVYKSFTADTKREAEYQASQYLMNRDRMSSVRNWTLGEAIDKYIELKEPMLSPITIKAYKDMRKTCFQSIMDVPIDNLNSEVLSEAVQAEMVRPLATRKGTPSAKTVRNAYGLISSTLSRYLPDRVYRVDLPKSPRRIRTLPEPSDIYKAVKGTRIELACLLSMWLSFTESEIRGLTKSKSIDGDYITIREVMIRVGGKDVRKELAKTDTRTRRHRMPDYIKELIDAVDGDIIVPFTPAMLYNDLQNCLKAAGIDPISFHDLRHINASVMAVLHIPDKYAQERGGWKTDNIMKTVYTEVFSSERQQVDDTVNAYFMRVLATSEDKVKTE